MKLNEVHVKKSDPVLQEALRQAQGDEHLRAVMVLASGEDQPRDDEGNPIRPDQFPSRSEYRRALIAQRERRLTMELADTVSALEGLSLTVRGGKTSPAVVVEGAARQILSSLELPGVRHASLDQPLEITLPRRPTEAER